MNLQRRLLDLIARRPLVGSEFAQARVRVMNVSPFCLYLVLAWHFKWHAVSSGLALGALTYIAYAVLWVFVVEYELIEVGRRRMLATILDQLLPALGMYLAGFLAGLVAWVPALGSIGSGMRFGTRYCWLSSAVGGVAMSAAFFLSPDWRSIPGVAAGIVLANILLPLYVVVLVKRLKQEKSTLAQRAAYFEAATKRDDLTGLLNRAGFRDALEEFRIFDTRRGETAAVLVLDLDGFKAINDACGHATGDRVLKSVAMALTASLRSSDTVGRLGGDEFGIVLRHLVDASNAERIAAETLHAITLIATPREDLRLGASVGMCILPHADLHNPEDILENADRLMYAAKSAGKNQFRVFA